MTTINLTWNPRASNLLSIIRIAKTGSASVGKHILLNLAAGLNGSVAIFATGSKLAARVSVSSW